MVHVETRSADHEWDLRPAIRRQSSFSRIGADDLTGAVISTVPSLVAGPFGGIRAVAGVAGTQSFGTAFNLLSIKAIASSWRNWVERNKA